MHRWIRRTIGALFWGAILAAMAWFLLAEEGRSGSWLRELRRHIAKRDGHITVDFPGPALVEVGAEVHLGPPGDIGEMGEIGEIGETEETETAEPARKAWRPRPAGEIEALLDDAGRPMPHLYAWCRSVRVRIFDRDAVSLRADASARLILTPQTAAWVFQTLMTEQNLPRLAAEWNETMLAHREEIFDLLTPIVRDILIDVERQVETELPGFVVRHRAELQELGEELKQDFLEREFAGFFEKKLWPLAEFRIRPVIADISREIFREFPVWGLSWRLAYQALPFTSNDHVERAWRTFVDEKVIPILRTHADEVTAATRAIAKDLFSRQEVSSSIRGTFEALMGNPRFHTLIQTFLREVFLDNAEFQEAMRRRWQSPAARRALEVTTAYLEPTVRRMGDILFGTREEGITPEFARVLRAQILLKDLQRIVILPGSDEAGPFPDGSVPDTSVPAGPVSPGRFPDGARLRASVEWDLPREAVPDGIPDGVPDPVPDERGS